MSILRIVVFGTKLYSMCRTGDHSTPLFQCRVWTRSYSSRHQHYQHGQNSTSWREYRLWMNCTVLPSTKCPLKIHQFLAFQQFFSLTDEASESQVFFEERQNLRNVVSETLVKNRGYFSTNLCKSWWKWQEICQSGNNIHERCGCQENKTPDTETSKKVPQKISQDV